MRNTAWARHLAVGLGRARLPFAPLRNTDKLEELLLVGNPLYNEYRDNNAIPDYRVEVGGVMHEDLP